MKIVADRDIYRVEDFFSGHGDLVLLPGRTIQANHVIDADALLVRTVTDIDRKLIENSSIQFIGSATSGIDHVDQHYLDSTDINFAHAPGCNANAVVDYVFSSLAWIALQKERDWCSKTIGIVGAGHVGSTLARRAKQLGLEFVIHDPYLEASHELADYLVSLDDALNQDIVSLHTPLTKTGLNPTYHLLNQKNLAAVKNDATLINTSRGAVIDNNALAEHLARHSDLSVVLDVWEEEPEIHDSLGELAAVATPHIAGYSLKGKLLGTTMIYQEFCHAFSIQPKNSFENAHKNELFISESEDETQLFNKILLQAYPIDNDFLEFRNNSHDKSLSANFDHKRNTYKFRPEYSDFRINRETVSNKLATKLAFSGFVIA